jgi:hypothetical protein
MTAKNLYKKSPLSTEKKKIVITQKKLSWVAYAFGHKKGEVKKRRKSSLLFSFFSFFFVKVI